MIDWLGMAARPQSPRPELKARVLARATASSGRARWPIAAAALLVLGLGAGGGGFWGRRTLRTLREVDAARAAFAARVAALEDTLSLVRSPGTRVYQIPVSTNGRAGAVTIFDDRVTHRWLVSCSGLAPNQPGETYQMWFITESGMMHAALMPMDHDQPMVMTLEMPGGGVPVMGAAMSIEPRGGSAAPRGPMVFSLHL